MPDGDATPLPIRAEELGSIPTAVSPIPGERTGEIDANELVESYDEADEGGFASPERAGARGKSERATPK